MCRYVKIVASAVLAPAYGWTFMAHVAKVFRNQSFRELYLYCTANDTREPESMMNYEVTVEKSFARRLNIELTAHCGKGNNMIETVDMKNVNTGSFTSEGIEMAVDSQPARCLNVRASCSYLHTSLSDLTGAPKNRYSLCAAWQATPMLLIDADVQGTDNLYVSETIDNQNYALLNMRLRSPQLNASMSMSRPIISPTRSTSSTEDMTCQASPPREDFACDCDDPYATKFTRRKGSPERQQSDGRNQ